MIETSQWGTYESNVLWNFRLQFLGVTPGDLVEVESIDDTDAHVVDRSKFYPE